jgi:hypothetical protein
VHDLVPADVNDDSTHFAPQSKFGRQVAVDDLKADAMDLRAGSSSS